MLGGLILHNVNHFEALIVRDGKWYHSDGYSGSKLRPVNVAALAKRVVLNTAIYFMIRK
jgi:hypothetical protein